MKKILLLIAITSAFLLTHQSARAQHGHIYAGDSNHDGYLNFEAALPTGTLNYSNTVNFETGVNYFLAGYAYHGSAGTFTARHGSDSTPVSSPSGALSGGNIRMVLYDVSYSGPAINPTFAIFDVDVDNGNPDDGYVPLSYASVTMSADAAPGTAGGIMLTEPYYFNEASSDPYGHFHDRRFAATDYGTYTLTWALVNIGTGTGDSEDNPDSGLRYFTQTISAVPEPSAWALIGAAALAGLLGMRKRKSAAQE